jgi:hypothetical protein
MKIVTATREMYKCGGPVKLLYFEVLVLVSEGYALPYLYDHTVETINFLTDFLAIKTIKKVSIAK